ncbi:MAG: hypothetical protein AAFP70_11910, partial [Calditrichota bacterium]
MWSIRVLCIIISFTLLSIEAQHVVLEGKVRNTNTRRSISGVNIQIEQLQIGTISNSAGRFK